MREVGVLEAKTNLSALIEEVAAGGEEIVITRHGKPMVRLSAADSTAGVGRKRLSGAELLARFDALHAHLRAENPAIDNVTWEEILEWRDS